jgi:hypothetical protein
LFFPLTDLIPKHKLGIISEGFIQYATQISAAEGLSAQFVARDARRIDYEEEFDGAICLCEGAFGLAGNLDHHRKIISGVYNALRQGAPFVLTAINALSTARTNTDLECFDPYSCSSFHRSTIRNPEGETKDVTIYTTAFTYRELALLLEEAGFEICVGYGCVVGNFSRKPLGLDVMEIMMVARKK